MRALALLLLLATAAPAATYRGIIALTPAPGPAKTRAHGDLSVSFLAAKLDTAFRCRGKGCVFKRGFFVALCTQSLRATGRVTDRKTGVRCDFTGSCAGSSFVGTFACPDGRRGQVGLTFVRP